MGGKSAGNGEIPRCAGVQVHCTSQKLIQERHPGFSAWTEVFTLVGGRNVTGITDGRVLFHHIPFETFAASGESTCFDWERFGFAIESVSPCTLVPIKLPVVDSQRNLAAAALDIASRD